MCEAPDFDCESFPSKRVKARVKHWCRECRKDILPGEYYIRNASKTDGSVGSWASCLKCDRVFEAHAKAEHAMNGSASYVVGELLETVAGCIRHEPHYIVAFRAAWKGEEVPKAPPPPDTRRYSTVW